MILKSDTFPLDSFKSQTLVIALQNKTMLSCHRIVRLSSEIGDSRIDHGSIDTPFVNKSFWSVDDNFSVRSDVGEVNKLDTSVQQSLINKRNTESSRIEEESLKSVFSKIGEESNLSKRMNPRTPLSLILQSSDLSVTHPWIQNM